jgi:hypothetical protein
MNISLLNEALCNRKTRNPYKILGIDLCGKSLLRRLRKQWENNIKLYAGEVGSVY